MGWGDRLPGDSQALFVWLLGQDTTVLLDLLAYCAARSVHAIEGTLRTHRNDSDLLADALGVDMADWWQATPAKFFGHVSKAKGIEVVTQATGRDAGKEIGSLKKAEAADHAAAKVEGLRWLPTPLTGKAKAE